MLVFPIVSLCMGLGSYNLRSFAACACCSKNMAFYLAVSKIIITFAATKV